MKILVVGSGGREHALVWKIAQSPLVAKIYCAPGNAGCANLAQCVDISSDNVDGLLEFARDKKIDLTMVGPELPLVKGIVDQFTKCGLKIVGPTRDAAELEGSKVFSKNLMRKFGIPTATYRIFTSSKSALAFLKTTPYPVVIKADGLAGGKGAVICHNQDEGIVTVDGMMEKKVFGAAGNQIIIEEFLQGYEASIIALTDSKSIVVLETTQDHKRIFDNNTGPNTGGMGAYSPVPKVSEEDINHVIKDVLVPTVHAMNREGRPFKGILYAGVMFTRNGVRVLEYNVRFGDPETQPLMVRLKSDIVPLLLGVCNGTLEKTDIEWYPNVALCVVMASGGYPNAYATGYEIGGIEEAEKEEGVILFHAGTTLKNKTLVTAGGRVLGITATATTVDEARRNAYAAAAKITFKDAHYRKDIADCR